MKKKVAFFINGLYGGGAEKVLQTLLRFFNYDKYEVTLYSVIQDDIGTEYPANVEFKYIYRSTKGMGFLSQFLTLCSNKIALWIYEHFSPSSFYKLYVEGIYDIEIAFIEGYATRIVSGSTNSNSKKIAWVHIDLDSNHWTSICYRSQQEEKDCYLRFDTVVAVSDYVRSVNEQLFKGIKGSCTLYNPIDNEEILRKSKECSLDSHQTVRLVSSGRFTHQKAFDRLLRIVKRLKDERYPVELWLLGEGIMRAQLEDYIIKNGMSNYVTLLGFQNNPYKYIKMCDVFVCSSLAEGYSTVITEAMILGLPIVSTEVSGVREQLGKHSEYGIITDNDEDALYEGIKSMIENPQKMQYFKEVAEKRGRNFQIDGLVSAIEGILV